MSKQQQLEQVNRPNVLPAYDGAALRARAPRASSAGGSSFFMTGRVLRGSWGGWHRTLPGGPGGGRRPAPFFADRREPPPAGKGDHAGRARRVGSPEQGGEAPAEGGERFKSQVRAPAWARRRGRAEPTRRGASSRRPPPPSPRCPCTATGGG